MRVVFMGTPDFAARILESVAEQHEVVAVYTRPDAVRGRGNGLIPSPVKQVAMDRNLPVYTPRTLKDLDEQEKLRSLAPEVLVVAAYGMILHKEVLDIPVHGGINAHASLLPRWRGAAPVERGILAGDEEAGVCAMRMDVQLDAGPYCVCRSLPIGHKNAEELLAELADLGAEAILNALTQFEAGRVFWVEQDESLVTYAEKIGKTELFLEASDSAVQADRKVRAASDAHPCKCVLGEKNIALVSAQVADNAPEVAPGQVVFFQKRLYLGMADGTLELITVKPEGKKQMDAKSFAAGVQNIKSGLVTWRSLVG